MEESTVEAFPVEHSGETLDNSQMIKKLLENSRAAIMGAIELHNKPIFPYRYEVSVILTINAWELVMKAFLLTYHPEVKIFEGGWSKEFLKCTECVSSKLGKDFLVQKEGIDLLYKYRCDYIHFYGDNVELILYALLRPNILHFSDFLNNYFNIDLGSETNLIILPIGFKRIVSPIDFLSKNATEGSERVKNFVNSIRQSAQNLKDAGITDGLLINYSMAVENINRVKNADIVAGVIKDEDIATLAVTKSIKIGGFTTDTSAPKVQIEEKSLYQDKFKLTTEMLTKRLKEEVENMKFGKDYNEIIKEVKQDPNSFFWRYLDIHASPNKKSGRKGYYSESGLWEIKRKLSELGYIILG